MGTLNISWFGFVEKSFQQGEARSGSVSWAAVDLQQRLEVGTELFPGHYRRSPHTFVHRLVVSRLLNANAHRSHHNLCHRYWLRLSTGVQVHFQGWELERIAREVVWASNSGHCWRKAERLRSCQLILQQQKRTVNICKFKICIEFRFTILYHGVSIVVPHRRYSWIGFARMDWIDIQQSFPGLSVRSGLGDVSWIERKGDH